MDQTSDTIKPTAKQIRSVVSSYLRITKKYWKLSLPTFVLPSIGTVLVFYVPALIVAQLLVRIQKAPIGLADAQWYVILFAITWFSGEMLWRLAIHIAIRLEIEGVGDLFQEALGKLLKNDMAFFSDNFAGSLTKKTLAYARNFEFVTDIFLFNVFSAVLPLVFISVILWTISPWIVLALYVVFAAFLLLVIPLIRRRQKLVDKREKASNLVSGLTADIYTNIASVKGFAREKEELETYSQYVKSYTDKAKDSWDYQNKKIDMVISPLFVLINVVGLVLALEFSARGLGQVDDIFLSFTYFSTFSRTMWEFNGVYRRLESHLSDAAQFSYLLEYKPAVNDPKRPEKVRINDGKIDFKGVVFAYKKGSNVFHGLNLTVKPGEKIGLVGPSGGGKTTLTKLVLRLDVPKDGVISIDDQDISTITQRDLRGNIAYVPQEPILFHRSLTDNIRYGRPEATQEEVEEAARLAFAHDFIVDLPEGYDTLVGERGMKLSGGQKQRVAIARAMLVKAPILLLDEATSALDSKSEKLIAEALDNLMKNRTTLVIAHRLSTIKKLDRIVVMKDGEIVEDGNHAQLIKQKGLYAELWSHQSGDFLED